MTVGFVIGAVAGGLYGYFWGLDNGGRPGRWIAITFGLALLSGIVDSLGLPPFLFGVALGSAAGFFFGAIGGSGSS